MDVTVDPALAAERTLIEGLYQFYVYDFAEMYGPGEAFDVGADGKFASDDHLASYWRDADRWPLVIRVDSRVAGFVLLNTISQRGVAVDHAVAEFFVMRAFRRAGVGRIAAHHVFTKYPGRWELAIAAVNDGGRRFWPKVVTDTPGVGDIETFDPVEDQRARRILSFRVAGSADL